MAIPPQALALENAHVGPNGQPTLAEAFELLSDQWGAGDRDRELALHLLFISWYGLVEPEHITGFQGDEDTTSMLRVAFNDVYQYVAKGIERDPEMLYVVGLMANLAPWALGDANEWESRSERYRELYRRQAPEGIDASIFAERGAYGEYFGGQARVENGF
jgi:hypothetical protein